MDLGGPIFDAPPSVAWLSRPAAGQAAVSGCAWRSPALGILGWRASVFGGRRTGIWLGRRIRAGDWRVMDSQSLHVILISGHCIIGSVSFCNVHFFFSLGHFIFNP